MRAPGDQRLLGRLRTHDGATSGELARALGISRQAVHRHLTKLAERGRVRMEGAGRGARWRLAHGPAARFRFRTAGLAEDRAWEQTCRKVQRLGALSGEARGVFAYAFTELVNNAIEHSGSASVSVAVYLRRDHIRFEIVDSGIGALARIATGLRLAGPLEAIQEVSKGKVTTLPERHTGEGLFFCSRLADRFELESNGFVWVVDNLVGDFTVKPARPRSGTRVSFAASVPPRRTTREIFEAYTDEYEFTRTRTVVRLFAIGTEFVSRSQAKRLLYRLEQFREVVVDFGGIEAVGQGFCDEIFRIWARAHPATRLVPLDMQPAVEFMVRRAQAAGA
jgi:anti-sigma regulatory factor (Ser/Thr protein kinase)